MIRSAIKLLFIFSAIALVTSTYIYMFELWNFRNVFMRVQFPEFITGKYDQSFSTYLEDIKMGFVRKGELSDIDSIDIIIDREKLKGMSSDMPISGRDYKKAKMIINDEAEFKVSIRHRGTTQHHWLMRKKSLNIKLKNSKDAKKINLFRGRQIELLAPKTMYTIGDYLSMFGGDKLNLIIPRYKYVNLFINGKFEGLFQVSESINEDFLESRELPIGGIFEAENIGFSHKEGLRGSVFAHPFIWENDVENPHEDEHSYLLYELLTSIYKKDLQTVYSLIDYDYFVRILSFVYFNQSMHFDDVHNTKFYYNSEIGKFQQIVWDMNFLGSYYNGEVPKFFVSNDFHSLLLRDPGFVNNVYTQVYSLIKEGVPDEVVEEYSTMTDKLRKSKELDHYVIGALNVDAWTQAKSNVETVGNDMKKLLVSIEEPNICIQKRNKRLQINLSGEAAFYFGNDLLFPGRKIAVQTSGLLKLKYIVPATLSYDFGLHRLVSDRLKFKNSITGKEVFIGISDSCETIDHDFSFHPWEISDSAYKRLELQQIRSNYPDFSYSGKNITIPAGTHKIHSSIIIPEGATLNISPGATLSMDPNVSILSKGKVTAIGSSSEGIKIKATDSNDPFGVFATYGHGADGSRFNYFDIENGNEDIIGGRYFSGMFSAYYTDNVVVDNSIFRYAHADDALNFKYSDSSVRNSYFYQNRADAIDYDFMSGEISGNRFEENGNDAIDMSGSTTFIEGNIILKSGDKCISLGEATSSLVYNNLLNGCQIGIEVKDSSEPVILNNTIINNSMGINSYQKKKMFGSAKAKVRNTLLYNNKEEITFKNTFKGKKLKSDESKIDIRYSNIPGGYKGKGNIDTNVNDNQLWIESAGDTEILKKYVPGYQGQIKIGIISR